MLIDWFTTLAQALNFLILVYILKRLLYRPILRILDHRQQEIDQTRQEAKEAKDQADQELARYRGLRQEIEQAKSLALGRAEERARETEARLIEQAKQELGQKRQKMQRTLAREREQIYQDLEKTAQGVMLETLKNILDQISDRDLQRHLLDKFFPALAAEKKQPGQRIRLVLAKEIGDQERGEISKVAKDRLQVSGVDFEIDPSLLAGIRAEFKDHQLDLSLDSYLRQLEAELESRVQTPKPEPAGAG